MKFTINFINGREPIEVEGENFAAAVSKAVKQGVSLGGADLRHADLRNADLAYADLNHANLQHADLWHAKLKKAFLEHADLSYADLWYTDLRHSDLTCADLNHADLRNTDLSYAYFAQATLEGANMDYSCLPLWRGALNANVDKRHAVQLLYHACRWLQNIDDEECRNFLQIPEVKKLANQFHRVKECGAI